MRKGFIKLIEFIKVMEVIALIERSDDSGQAMILNAGWRLQITLDEGDFYSTLSGSV